jgi:hypothetical protein
LEVISIKSHEKDHSPRKAKRSLKLRFSAVVFASRNGGVEVEAGWYRMNRGALVVAVIVLISALIFPVVMLYEADSVYKNYVLQNMPYSADATARNQIFQQAQTQENPYLAALVVIEVLLLVVFGIFIWFAIKPPREKHREHEHPQHD